MTTTCPCCWVGANELENGGKAKAAISRGSIRRNELMLPMRYENRRNFVDYYSQIPMVTKMVRETLLSHRFSAHTIISIDIPNIAQ